MYSFSQMNDVVRNRYFAYQQQLAKHFYGNVNFNWQKYQRDIKQEEKVSSPFHQKSLQEILFINACWLKNNIPGKKRAKNLLKEKKKTENAVKETWSAQGGLEYIKTSKRFNRCQRSLVKRLLGSIRDKQNRKQKQKSSDYLAWLSAHKKILAQSLFPDALCEAFFVNALNGYGTYNQLSENTKSKRQNQLNEQQKNNVKNDQQKKQRKKGRKYFLFGPKRQCNKNQKKVQEAILC